MGWHTHAHLSHVGAAGERRSVVKMDFCFYKLLPSIADIFPFKKY